MLHLSFTESHARKLGLAASVAGICAEADRLARAEQLFHDTAMWPATARRLVGKAVR